MFWCFPVFKDHKFLNNSNIYSKIYLHNLLNRKKTDNLKYVVENADYIVCEQIRNYSFLKLIKNTTPPLF